MKKITVSLFFVLLAAFSFAQDLPSGVKSAFDAKFSGAEALNHIAAGDKHIIMFKHENRIHKATFSTDGSWQETMSVLPLTEAPQSVKDYLANNHAEVDFNDLWEVASPSGNFLKVTSDKLAVFFDTSGAFQRSEDIADPDADLR